MIVITPTHIFRVLYKSYECQYMCCRTVITIAQRCVNYAIYYNRTWSAYITLATSRDSSESYEMWSNECST